jgi:hypothetical protein
MRYRTVPVSSIIVGKDRARKDFGDIAEFAANIKERGLIHPIIVDSDLNLACGERRLLAFKHLGLEKIDVKIIDLDLLMLEHDENEFRKDFTVSERVAIAKKIEDRIGNRRGQRTDKQPLQNFAEVPGGKTTREFVAAKAGFGNGETYRQAQEVVNNAISEVVEAMDEGIISPSDAFKIVNEPPAVQKKVIEDVINGGAKTVAEALRERNSQRDRAGKLWPRHVLPDIEARKDLQDFRVLLSKALSRAAELQSGPMSTHIEWTPIIEKLEEIKKTCLHGTPDYVCPYCGGNGKAGERGTCKPCKSKGWVPARIWRQSPVGQEAGVDEE